MLLVATGIFYLKKGYMAKNFKVLNFEYSGIKRITIPKTDSDFNTADYGWSIIKKYLSNILSAHRKNALKIDYLYNYFLGRQDILAKERLHKVNACNNNIVVENHAYRQVEFKVGFICGEKRDYTNKLDTENEDLKYLNRYFTDCNFFEKDSELKEWIYTTGIGVTHTAPRTDIIITDGIDELTNTEKTRYATIEEGYNIEYEAPFTFDCVDPKENFVVYSSARNKEPLFCVSYVDVDLNNENITPQIGKQLLVETRYASFVFTSDFGFNTFYWEDNDKVIKSPKNIHYLPLIEHAANKDRIGIVETNRSLFNTINTIRSAVNDMTIDNSNAILVFKNVDIKAEQVSQMKKAGAVIITDNIENGNKGNADLTSITIEIPYDKLSTYVDQLIQNVYDISGVPMASGQVTSGGDTGQARLLGGGWNNAYTIAHKEIRTLLGYDYEQLKLILMLCKQVPNCPLDELYASIIDINYRINQNDNLLVKAQAMKYMFDMHCDLEFILKVCGLSNDIKTDSKAWRDSIKAFYQEQLEISQKESKTTEVIETENKSVTTENNSKE